MKSARKAKGALLGVALLAFGLASLAQAEVVQSGHVRVSFGGDLTPQALPRQGSAPVRVAVDAKIGSTDSETPPQLRRIAIAINRFGRFTPQGLPICTLREIQPSTTANALKACRGSLVGEGQFSAKVLLGQQAPSGQRQGVCLLRSPRGQAGDLRPRLWDRPHSHLVHPALHDQADQGHLRQRPRRRPAGGDRQLRLHHRPLAEPRRNFSYHGQKRSFLSASCPAPKGFPGATFPFAKASFGFGKKTLTSTLTRNCKVRG